MRQRILSWGCKKSEGYEPGAVRLNGKTIGNGASGATERSNDDTVELFCHLWHNFPELPVTGGRGFSAEEDFAMSKMVNLPVWAGRVMVLRRS
jgi:hypothetical protein